MKRSSLTRILRHGFAPALLAAAALSLAACLNSDGGGDKESVNLTGRVVSSNNGPVAGVVVRLAGSGASDTTDATGRYHLTGAASGSAAGGVVLDTLYYARNGLALARVSVTSWIDTLPDVEVVQRDISGLLDTGSTTIAKVKAVLTGDGIDSGSPVVTEFYYNALTGNYSGFMYFPPASSVRNYSVQVNVYGTGDVLLGRSVSVPFNSFAGNITVPAFKAGNAKPVAKAGADTAVATGAAVLLRGTASDSIGGTIAKWEWSIGGGSFVETSTGDTSFTRGATGTYPCVLRVTDNDGNQALDTLIATVAAHGTQWTARTSGTSAALNGVVWTGTQFVAVGSGTSLTSPDGITWTSHTAPASLYSVAWTGKKLVATVSSNSVSAAAYYTSTDGITWTSGTLPTMASGGSAGPIVVSVADTTVLAASQSATSRFIARSEDHGATWIVDTLPRAPTVNGPITSINHFTRHAGLIVGVGNDGIIATSTGNGVWTWRADMGSFPRPYGGVYDYTMQSIVSTGTRAVAVGYAGHVMRSTDGITWPTPRIAGGIPPEQAGGSSFGDLFGVAYNGNTLVAVGNGFTVLSADDGENWAPVAKETTYMRGIATNGTLFVAVGNGGTIVTSD